MCAWSKIEKCFEAVRDGTGNMFGSTAVVIIWIDFVIITMAIVILHAKLSIKS